MYNRYIPAADGTYRRQTIYPQMQQDVQVEQTQSAENNCQFPLPISLDSNDLLVLAVILLVLFNSDDQDRTSMLVTLVAFLLLN